VISADSNFRAPRTQPAFEGSLRSNMGRRARRAGAGRKPTRVRPGPPHTSRPDHDPRTPVHVTLRAIPTSVSLRSSRVFPHLYGALAAASFDAFRLVHFSVQSDHLHLIVEADSGRDLARGLQGLGVRVRPRDQSRAWSSWLGLGRAISRASTANAARSPLGSRLRTHEFRKHLRAAPGIDPCSSGRWFDGWSSEEVAPAGSRPVVLAQTWLGSIGWRRGGGPIDYSRETPAARIQAMARR